MLFGLIFIQIMLGVITNSMRKSGKVDFLKVKGVRKAHQFLGYLMYITYNVLLLIAWYTTNYFYGFIAWDSFLILIWIFTKFFRSKMEKKIIDNQTIHLICPSIGNIEEIRKHTEDFLIFADYVYDARGFEKEHPGGFKVIELVKGREVDRFIYGMYSVELYPELAPISHSADSMQKIGLPIAKLVCPPTYSGINEEFNVGTIRYLNCISTKTQIYAIGIVQKYIPIVYQGYTDIRQLGQYYSLTINGKITRLYTAVNFLALSNIHRMDGLLNVERPSQLKKISPGKVPL